ncbi:NAD-dependent DNA ligase LigA [Buchnera aphidicola]|uniref:NAD-dependent DNA ligase LigA n=1 Tax=Buchnera aphidicola TaxID=9 RepID=UPI0031B826B9
MSLIIKIEKLKFLLKKYSYFYYNLSSPLISDLEYDYLVLILKKLEKKFISLNSLNSPTKNVGSFLSPYFFKIKHLTPMLSLKNIFSMKEYFIFIKKIYKKLNYSKKLNVSCELKFDGVAVNLLYKNNKLIHAATRGNGFFGEDITENILNVKFVPLYLFGKNVPKLIEIRGEIVLLRSDFLNLNNYYKNKNKNIFSNARNAASGILRTKKNNIEFLKKLIFFCHSYGYIKYFKNHYNFIKQCKLWGFYVHNSIKFFNSINSVKEFLNIILKKRYFFQFDIDGIVIKINSIFKQKILGYNRVFPFWAIALKFNSNKKKTKLLDVEFKVGKSGIITPIAILKPVNISGVNIKKALLYNKNIIRKMDLYIGDFVILVRSGDVIPKIINVIKSLRKDVFYIRFPKFCPICNNKIIKNKNNLYYCNAGLNCKAQLKKKFLHFVSFNGFNIFGLGKKNITLLIKNNLIKNFSDLFYLNVKKISFFLGIGKKLSSNIIISIESSKKIKFSNFIYSLCIKDVGVVMSKKLAFYFVFVKFFLLIDINDKKLINYVGINVVKNVFFYVNSIKNKKNILNLINVVNIYNENKETKYLKNNIFYNKNIVLTGKLNKLSRSKINFFLLNLKANVKNFISKNIKLLIVGNTYGKKYEKAKELNIKIINEKEFLFFYFKYKIYY